MRSKIAVFIKIRQLNWLARAITKEPF